jgi:hypothetical protein
LARLRESSQRRAASTCVESIAGAGGATAGAAIGGGVTARGSMTAADTACRVTGRAVEVAVGRCRR